MPTYDYLCTSCQHAFEEIVTLAEKEQFTVVTPCPMCGKKKLKQTPGAPMFIYDRGKSIYKRAGDGWKEVQDKIKRGQGRGHTIRTK
jgi:putative FmdB family regulatory protein